MAELPIPKKPAAKSAKPIGVKIAAAAPVQPHAAMLPVSKPVALKAAKAPAKPVMPPIAAPVVAAAFVATAPEATPVTPAIANVIPETTPAAALAAAIPEGKIIMNDTINTIQENTTDATKDATDRATSMFGDVNVRAKAAMEKGTKAVEDMVEFSKGNLEAMVASSRVAAKGAEEIAKYSADYGRQSLEKANATAKQFAAVKSPTEFMQLQSEVAKSALDSLVAEGAKFTESYMKLLGDIAQPLSNRYAVAADKVKTAVAA